jgi:hypothetical protein
MEAPRFRNCVNRLSAAETVPYSLAAFDSPDKNADQPSARPAYVKIRLKPEQKLPTFTSR